MWCMHSSSPLRMCVHVTKPAEITVYKERMAVFPILSMWGTSVDTSWVLLISHMIAIVEKFNGSMNYPSVSQLLYMLIVPISAI